jgi:acetyl-CoA carboxylase carboxyl transferase subunit beta
MAWFKKEKKPRQPRREKLEIPADVWEKCEACGHTDIREKFVRNLNVCPNCDHHRRIRAHEYAAILLDDGTMEELEVDLRSTDPLGFPDYPQRLKKAINNAGDTDAILAASGMMDGAPVNLGVMDFAFMGGSMGSVVGEKVTRVFERALERRVPALIFAASGGARMQEGILSLMQMAKTSAAISRLREAGVPYLSILLHPTTGGVAASFSMLGDLHIAEPRALIGFAGPRVIQNTIRQSLPPGFQRSEFLQAHGFVDLIVPRKELRGTIVLALRWLGVRPAAGPN